jgi:hypothetical protein
MRLWTLQGEVITIFRSPISRIAGELKLDLGLLKLEPTVVGLSKFNESVQKLRNGEVAG